MTEDQRYYRKWARGETTQCRRKLKEMESWVELNMNRANFHARCAAGHAKRSASLAFRAHPELRVAAIQGEDKQNG